MLKTQDEKDRLTEILLYYYFTRQDPAVMRKAEFWTMIQAICMTYGVDSNSIAKATRVLMAEDNRPTEEEGYYLLAGIGLTVRPLRAISGIYWQKQKAFAEKFEKSGPPTIRRRINDPAMRYNIRTFLTSLYGAIGVFSNMTLHTLVDGPKMDS